MEGQIGQRRLWGVVEELDGRIGDLLKVLADEELEKNTGMVFMSDNGPNRAENGGAANLSGA